jgi:hypothetical protein
MIIEPKRGVSCIKPDVIGHGAYGVIVSQQAWTRQILRDFGLA